MGPVVRAGAGSTTRVVKLVQEVLPKEREGAASFPSSVCYVPLGYPAPAAAVPLPAVPTRPARAVAAPVWGSAQRLYCTEARVTDGTHVKYGYAYLGGSGES